MSIIINPGTETQTNHNESNAIKVAKQIVKDIGKGVWKRNQKDDDTERGWYAFIFEVDGRKVDVDIPGIEAKTVIKGEPWVSPRLYVNGSSWLYGYALGFIAEDDK